MQLQEGCIMQNDSGMERLAINRFPFHLWHVFLEYCELKFPLTTCKLNQLFFDILPNIKKDADVSPVQSWQWKKIVRTKFSYHS